MGNEDISKLRKEKDDLKGQLASLRKGMVTFKERIESTHPIGELQKSINYVSDENDDIRAKGEYIVRIQEDLKKLEEIL